MGGGVDLGMGVMICEDIIGVVVMSSVVVRPFWAVFFAEVVVLGLCSTTLSDLS